MRKLDFIFLAFAASLLCGCLITSLHPLYTEKELVFEPKLLGTWLPDEAKSGTTWTFEKGGEKRYHVIYDDDQHSSLLAAHLAQIGTNLFLNLRISQNGMEEIHETEGPYMGFLVPAHHLAKINLLETHLELRLLDVRKTGDYLKKNPTALRHEVIENGRIVLTASTKELQDFLLKTANDAELFTSAMKFKKQAIKQKEL